jgi:hypothetical protein
MMSVQEENVKMCLIRIIHVPSIKFITAPNYCFLVGAVTYYSWNGGKIYIHFSKERFRFLGGGDENYLLSGQDAPPAPPAPAPQTPPAWSRQEQTGLSERQRSARTRGSHAAEQTLVCPQDCIVGIASALHSATNEVETGMQACSRAAAEMRRRTTCTHSRACTHTHIHTQTHTCAGTHTHKGTHTQAHRRTDTHAQARTHIHSLAPLHKHTHTL